MARITTEGIKGMIGDVIYYVRDGKNYMRSRPKPRKKKKAPAPDSLNGIFATVSKFGSGIVMQLKPFLDFKPGLKSYNNTRGWMRNLYAAHLEKETWELSAKKSGMCQLNPVTDLRDLIRFDIRVSDKGDGKVEIIIPPLVPEEEIRVPTRTMKVNLKLIVVTSPIRNAPLSYTLCTEQFSFNFSNQLTAGKSFEMQTNGRPGDVATVTAALSFEHEEDGKMVLNTQQKWLPAAIIAMGKLS